MNTAASSNNIHPLVTDIPTGAAFASVVKKCSKCGKILPLSEFESHNKARDGHHRFCKECGAKIKSLKTKAQKQDNQYRPTSYAPQPGNKAILTLADFTDENIFAELRRRGYNGELRFSKVITV